MSKPNLCEPCLIEATEALLDKVEQYLGPCLAGGEMTRARLAIDLARCGGKPLFIPLRSEWFDAFAAGSKTIEYRPAGPKWNEKTCPIGRPVVLSRGYGKKARLYGRVSSFEVSREPSLNDAWIQCYGPGETDVACIGIDLSYDDITTNPVALGKVAWKTILAGGRVEMIEPDGVVTTVTADSAKRTRR